MFALQAAVSKIRTNFQNCHDLYIWAWNLASNKRSRNCIYSLSTPRGWNWGYFCSTGSSFRNMGWFSKLPYLGMKLGHWPKFQKLHIYSYSTQGSRNWAYFCSSGETWPLTKDPEVAHIPFHPKGLKLRLFSLYGQRFLRYELILKIAKVPEVSHILSKLFLTPKFYFVLLYNRSFSRLLRFLVSP